MPNERPKSERAPFGVGVELADVVQARAALAFDVMPTENGRKSEETSGRNLIQVIVWEKTPKAV
ncbi:hypothetical protein [Thiorhodovibrio frisius]|uniref:Uncharacterized protein n=1 Tax=Thiorhodovibrio frisius TaxID=631362 RepID=H8Z568_9GAMM|nr:hypothetical protein [Thiorhodovibrio frisius]EIC20475.1 hypothetical protein Thi970DRAFT_04112 [Thiorhodovibrio frisius]WPL21216.1 hypothetical protein Thiofri_01327 [Thiorhodovibrio frisius]